MAALAGLAAAALRLEQLAALERQTKVMPEETADLVLVEAGAEQDRLVRSVQPPVILSVEMAVLVFRHLSQALASQGQAVAVVVGHRAAARQLLAAGRERQLAALERQTPVAAVVETLVGQPEMVVQDWLSFRMPQPLPI